MMKVSLREFAELPEEKVLCWRGFRMKVEVTDDYGKKAFSDTYALMLTWVGLLIHRKHPEVKYSIDQLVPSNKTDEGKKNVVYNDDTLAIPINYTLRQVMPGIDDPVANDDIKLMVYMWQCMLNNIITVLSEEAMISATAEDVADLMDDEGIKEIVDKVRRHKVSIDEGEELFADYIRTSETLDYNTMALLTRTGGVSINQAYQTVGVRGAVFDLNNTIQPNPIMDNYAGGIGNLADNLGDSRSSGKALISNGRGLKDSEWFHRKANLFSAVIQGIDHLTDCGSKSYAPITITCKEMIRALMGKFMLTPEGKEELITDKVAKVIKAGEVVEVRTVAFCNLDKTGDVCGRCYGKLKAHIPYNRITRRDANIGMYSSTTLCNPLGQKMLSTKHFIRNAVTKAFEVLKKDIDILKTNGDEIFLTKGIVRPGTKMILRSSIVKDLSDFRSLDTLDEVTMDKLPHFAEVVFEYEIEDIMIGGTTTQRHSCTTSVSSRHGRFSMGFLQYLMDSELQVQDRRFVTVDLADWNHVEPIFVLPYTREDLDQHRARVENFLTFNKRNTAWKKQVVTPKVFGETLAEFWTLINQETKGINMVYLEVVLAAALTTRPEQGSFELALGDREKYFSSFINCIENRGSGTLMIFEKVQSLLSTPKTFLVKDRQASPLEVFFQNGVS